MSDAGLLLGQLRYEQKQYWRNPASAVFSVAFPAIILLVIGGLSRNQTVRYLGDVPYDQYLIPAIVVFGIVGATFTNLAVGIAIRRDSGVLKRLRGTPLPPWAYLSGVVLNAMVVSLLLTVATIVIGVALFGVTLYPTRFGGLALGVVCGALCFCSLGLAVSCLIPNADAAPAVANVVIFPIIFISGVFFPVESGTFISGLANVFPLRHLVQSLYAAFDPLHSGAGFEARDLLVCVAWGAGGLVVAMRRFRWTPAR